MSDDMNKPSNEPNQETTAVRDLFIPPDQTEPESKTRSPKTTERDIDKVALATGAEENAQSPATVRRLFIPQASTENTDSSRGPKNDRGIQKEERK